MSLESCKKQGRELDIHDPWANPVECRREYGLRILRRPIPRSYDVVVIAVAHQELGELGARGVRGFCRRNRVVYDVKHLYPANEVDGRL